MRAGRGAQRIVLLGTAAAVVARAAAAGVLCNFEGMFMHFESLPAPLPSLLPHAQDYLTGLALHLGSLRRRRPEQLASGDGIVGDVIIDSSTTVGKGCKIGPNVTIGQNCTIGDGVRLENCVLLHRVKVRGHHEQHSPGRREQHCWAP